MASSVALAQGIPLSVGALLCAGVSDYVYKRAARAQVQANQLLMVQSWCYAAVVALYGTLTGTLVPEAPALWGALAGIFAFTGFYQFARSLHGGLASINAAIFRLSFVISAALAMVLLGESVKPLKLLGLGLAFAAAWLLLGTRAPHAPRSDRADRGQPWLRIGSATVCMGIASLIYKIGLRAGATPAALLMAQACVVILLGCLITWRLEGKVRIRPGVWPYALRTGGLLAVAFILLTEALLHGEASVIIPIAQMGFVVTALLGVVFLREPFSLRTGCGLAGALGALACLALA